MKYLKVNDEVFYNRSASVGVGAEDIVFLKNRATETARKRSRLCTHGTPEDPLHEMFIIHNRDAYIPPHKHLSKRESFHIIEGNVDVIIFKDDGEIAEVIQMGDYNSGKKFYYRIAPSCFHTFIIRSDVLVFHETTTGPFRREDTLFAEWAPDVSDDVATTAYICELAKNIENIRRSHEAPVS